MDFEVDFLRKAYPQVDLRLIKAAILEHGDDVESTLSFLDGVANERKDASPVEDTRERYVLHESSSTVDIKAYTEAANPELSNSNASSCNEDILADIVEETKTDKELVINLVKEVSNLRAKADLENIAALKAKGEAAVQGESLLQKADEVRKQTAQKKQENLLRMGEIYGEKAVLATEARELKARLEQVKLQQEKAIRILNEIQVTLQGCYDAAVKEREMAEKEGLINEVKAQKVLAEEEMLRAVVQEESQKLDMEAEECMQLKEFLAHHGSVVDSLQGEMSVLCEDVESFKRQVEEGMWSSISTSSLQLNVNPEGPYTFRRCNMPSTTASQDLGQSVESSRYSYSRLSTSTSQEVPNLSVHSSISSQELDKEVRGACNGSDEDTELAENRSFFGRNRENVISNITDSASSDVEAMLSSFDPLEMLRNACRGDILGRSSASMNGIEESGHMHDTYFTTERRESELDNANFTTEERSDSEFASVDWVFTNKQLEDSQSSSSSSMVKIDADDYATE